jgi:hypothetical protein
MALNRMELDRLKMSDLANNLAENDGISGEIEVFGDSRFGRHGTDFKSGTSASFVTRAQLQGDKEDATKAPDRKSPAAFIQISDLLAKSPRPTPILGYAGKVRNRKAVRP